MNNETLLPETNQAAPKMQYADLKYPLTQRGLEIPAAMDDYINKLMQQDTVDDTELEAIRAEMKQMFQQADVEVPEDFDANFDQWFGIINQEISE